MASSDAKQHRKKAIICNFGTGGHTEQMKRLLSHIETGELILIAQSPIKPNDGRFQEYSKIYKVRPDYANVLGILAIPFFVIANLIQTMKLFIRFDIRILISTGSGVAIVPSIIARLFGVEVLFFESWSRFTVPSISGLIMYRIADVFFVQNEEIKKFYKKARFMGQL
jgi:UDP-N-acetylglucosamine:LPS N-acetylglucosamine transferase